MRPFVSILILNWNGAEETIACAHSLGELEYPSREIVVIDNGSTDSSVDEIVKAIPEATLIQSASNLGFAAGNNLGINYALSRRAEYVWLLNSDTTVQPDALSALVETACSSDQIGVVGSVLRPMGAQIAVEAWGGGVIYPALGWAERKTRPFAAVWAWVSGASMLIRTEMLEEVGLLDERYFFFMEDVDLCYRAARAGWGVRVASDSVVYHRGQAAVNRGTSNLSLMGDKFHAHSTGVFLGAHGGRLSAGSLFYGS